MAEKTVPKQLEPFEFKKGQSGNPKGRPKGSRNKLGQAFIDDLYASWQEHGPETIETVRAEKPDQYLKVIASLLPKELHLKDSQDDLSDDDIIARIRELDEALRPFLGGAYPGETFAFGDVARPPKKTSH